MLGEESKTVKIESQISEKDKANHRRFRENETAVSLQIITQSEANQMISDDENNIQKFGEREKNRIRRIVDLKENDFLVHVLQYMMRKK